MKKKSVAIVVGGGPAPGINGVIAAATIEAVNRGHTVYGINYGFSRILQGDRTCVTPLGINDVSRISSDGGSVLFTSRANPTKSPEMLQAVLDVLKSFDVGYLITIGGDDTASSSWAIGKAAHGEISVGHVPKTIDNDLPLPGLESTFGFQTAREAGTRIVETLMEDARTTSRWYLVVAMGRKAGHLALGIGISAQATLTVIPEQFPKHPISIRKLSDLIISSMLKRLADGKSYGVTVLAEGLAEILDMASIPELSSAERDPHGNIRFAEVDFGRIVKNAIKTQLEEMGIKLTVVDKNVGYELRCGPPNSFDQEYTRLLGYGVVDFLLGGGSEAMMSRQGQQLVPIPFTEMVDEKTGRARIRQVDTGSVLYSVAQRYMIRLQEKDLGNSELMTKMASYSKLSPAELCKQFRDVI